jgi:hypothetical protein
MGGYKFLAVLAASCALIALTPVPPLKAAPALAASQMGTLAVEQTSPLQRVGIFHHRKRTQAFYCYPRKYWWFYRPYTTEPQNYERCMPYFHYLGEGQGRPAKAYRDIK